MLIEQLFEGFYNSIGDLHLAIDLWQVFLHM